MFAVTLASYPKSGRTWLSFMLANYFNELHNLVPVVNFETVYRFIQSDGAPIPPLDEWWEGKKVPRIRATHGNPGVVRGDRILRVVRNPYDTIVSDFYHNTHQHKIFRGTLSEYVRSPRHGAARYKKYHRTWDRLFEGRSGARQFVIQYEDMKSDPGEALRKAVIFCGVPPKAVRHEAVRKAVNKSSFSVMKTLEQNGPRIPNHRYDLQDDNALRTRQGGVGASLRELSADDILYIKNVTGIDPPAGAAKE